MENGDWRLENGENIKKERIRETKGNRIAVDPIILLLSLFVPCAPNKGKSRTYASPPGRGGAG